MTRSTNARVAGVAYLLYIGVALPSMILSRRATAGDGMTARLATMSTHAGDVRLAAVPVWLIAKGVRSGGETEVASSR